MISKSKWQKYIQKLAAIDQRAAEQMRAWIEANGLQDDDALIEYAYALATKYGEASGELACEMYDMMAQAQGAMVPAAVPAETATMQEVAKGAMWGKYHSPSQIPSILGRQVRQAGADTMIQNAVRDHAEWAWIPSGDTCAFCITLASRGWQDASRAVLKGNHAEHIHANCDCTFAISFDSKGRRMYDSIYDPDRYKEMYDSVEGSTASDRVNSLRRQIYQQRKDYINAQKRDAYQARKPIIEDNLNNAESLKFSRAKAKTGNMNAKDYSDLRAFIKSFNALSSDKAVPFLREESRQWIEKLNVTERRVISKYTYNPEDNPDDKLYLRINKMLRGEIPSDPKLENYSQILSDAINKYYLEANLKVYRNTEIDILGDCGIGDILVFDGFTSTSVTKNGALNKKYHYEIYVRKGTRCAYVENLSHYEGQRELLIDKKTYVRVLSKQGNEAVLEVLLL